MLSSYHTLIIPPIPIITHQRTHLRILLLNIRLGTSLLCLPNIMLVLRRSLCITITSDSRNCTTDCTSNTVCDAGAEIVELTLGFLGFTFSVLLGALLL